MPDSISDRLRRMVLWLMATDRRKRPQSVADIRSVLNRRQRTSLPTPAKGEEGDDVTIVLPKSDQDKVNDAPRCQRRDGGDASSGSPSAASDDSSTTDNPSAADDETEIVQDDPSVEVEEKKSSKWKWILVVLIFAVIGFFGAKYFLSPGQDTAPSHIRTRLHSGRFYRRRATTNSCRPAANPCCSGCYRQDQRGQRLSSRLSGSEEEGSEARETLSEEEEWQTVPLRLRRTLPSVHSLEESHSGRQQRELRIGIGQESFLRIELDLVF